MTSLAETLFRARGDYYNNDELVRVMRDQGHPQWIECERQAKVIAPMLTQTPVIDAVKPQKVPIDAHKLDGDSLYNYWCTGCSWRYTHVGTGDPDARAAAMFLSHVPLPGDEHWAVSCGCDTHGDHMACRESCAEYLGCNHPRRVEVTADTLDLADKWSDVPVNIRRKTARCPTCMTLSKRVNIWMDQDGKEFIEIKCKKHGRWTEPF